MVYHDTDSVVIDKNHVTTTTPFGVALEAIKKGKKAKRQGWNGKDQYIDIGHAFSYVDTNDNIINPYHNDVGASAIIFHGTSGEQVGWLASQADMLAEDWLIID